MSKVFLRAMLETVKVCGVIVFVLGFTATVGHLTKIARLHTWFATPMGLNTSIALLFAGVGIFVAGKRLDDLYEKRSGNAS